MKIDITTELNTDADVVALGLFDENEDVYKSFNTELGEELDHALSDHHFKKKFGSIYSTKLNNARHRRILIIGLGPKEEFTLEKLRRSITKAVKYAKAKKYATVSTNIAQLIAEDFSAKELGRAFMEGTVLSNYQFHKYLSIPEDEPQKEIQSISLLWKGDKAEFTKGCNEGQIIAEATNMAKDLVNEPAIIVTPTLLENVAKEIAKKDTVSLKVLNKEDMEKEGMGALLGVSSGSDQPPKLLILEYKGAGGEPWTAIVGKGITFDSGGLNLKPGQSMATMKADMSGAAAVLGTIQAVADLGVKKNILGVIPASENTINGSAIKPGDVLIASNGKTIEIGNTDAEGRLILADALSYAEKVYSPEIMIDLATLTGACVVALGYQISGLVSTDDKLAQQLELAGEQSYDRVWRLPFLEEYQDAMKGTITDLNNIAPRGHGAGAITAGVFLSKFIDRARWAHIDIAGPAFLNEEKNYLQKGGTGAGIRLLTYYFLK